MEHTKRSMNRQWLGAFLRSRRARLSPADFGFPVVKRRRSVGLRRDEVAQMAGISIAYYTWIEQGRDINMSPEVLNSIARALQFDETERAHLFTLVGIDVPEYSVDDGSMHPAIAHIFDRSQNSCALLYDAWFNVTNATALASAAFEIYPSTELGSNLIYRLFANPAYRSYWDDWEGEAHMAVGMLRQALAKRHGEPEGIKLLEALLLTPDFERVWNIYDVRSRPSPPEFFRDEPCVLHHATAGVLRIYRLATSIPTRIERTLVLCSPADAATAQKFATLVERRTAPRLSIIRS